MTGPTQPKDAQPIPKPKELFEFASKHFVLFSALSIIAGVVVATIGLYAYLSVFDWHLIWVIEYGDILKFGLVALAAISGSAALIGSMLDIVYAWLKTKRKSTLIGLVVILTLGFAANLIVDYYSNTPTYLKHVFWYLSALSLLWVLTILAKEMENPRSISVRRAVDHFLTLVVVITVWGGTYGVTVRDSWGFKRDVYTLQGSIRDVGLVMITSRYVVLYDGDHSIIIPVGDVTKIEARPTHTTG
jgi:hypothetical protein